MATRLETLAVQQDPAVVGLRFERYLEHVERLAADVIPVVRMYERMPEPVYRAEQ